MFFPSVLGTFTKTDHRHNKACINTFKRSHIIQNIFSGHSEGKNNNNKNNSKILKSLKK